MDVLNTPWYQFGNYCKSVNQLDSNFRWKSLFRVKNIEVAIKFRHNACVVYRVMVLARVNFTGNRHISPALKVTKAYTACGMFIMLTLARGLPKVTQIIHWYKTFRYSHISSIFSFLPLSIRSLSFFSLVIFYFVTSTFHLRTRGLPVSSSSSSLSRLVPL